MLASTMLANSQWLVVVCPATSLWPPHWRVLRHCHHHHHWRFFNEDSSLGSPQTSSTPPHPPPPQRSSALSSEMISSTTTSSPALSLGHRNLFMFRYMYNYMYIVDMYNYMYIHCRYMYTPPMALPCDLTPPPQTSPQPWINEHFIIWAGTKADFVPFLKSKSFHKFLKNLGPRDRVHCLNFYWNLVQEKYSITCIFEVLILYCSTHLQLL